MEFQWFEIKTEADINGITEYHWLSHDDKTGPGDICVQYVTNGLQQSRSWPVIAKDTMEKSECLCIQCEKATILIPEWPVSAYEYSWR